MHTRPDKAGQIRRHVTIVADMPHLRITEAASLLGVSDDTVRRWAEHGRLHLGKGENRRAVVDGVELASLARELAEQPAAGKVQARKIPATCDAEGCAEWRPCSAAVRGDFKGDRAGLGCCAAPQPSDLTAAYRGEQLRGFIVGQLGEWCARHSRELGEISADKNLPIGVQRERIHGVIRACG